jgi:uncharacterized membrane protein YdjX (TVP38/TMEM64 family)
MNRNPTEPGAAERGPGRWVPALLLASVLLASVALAMNLDIPDVGTLKHWIASAGPWGWLAALASLTVALVIPTPRSALSVLAGAVFGFLGGLALVLAGGLLGGLAGFGLSRWVGRDLVTRLAGERLTKVDRFVSSQGLLTVLTARLLPAPPFAVVSYAAGLSGVHMAPYTAGTAVGLLPGSLFYVGIGASVTGVDAVTAYFGPWRLTAVTLTVVALTVAWWWRRRPDRPH